MMNTNFGLILVYRS